MLAQPRENPYLVTTILPSSISVYAILTADVSPGDNSSSQFYRERKVALVEGLAGGTERVGGVKWCEEGDCDLGMVVKKPVWVAEAVVGLLEGS